MKISAYTKIYNGIAHDYPWRESIRSMSGFSDEVIVLDSGSNDGTYEELLKLAVEDKKIIVCQSRVDLNSRDFAHQSDGLQKGRARALCKGDVLFQFDCDEVVHKNDYKKIRNLCSGIYENGDFETVFLYPMIEFWGKNKIRTDIPFYKPRISLNGKITHDIPIHLVRTRDDGSEYSVGSDGCDFVDFNRKSIPSSLWISEDAREHLINTDVFRSASYARETKDKDNYLFCLNMILKDYGTIYHYSWRDIPRKIRTYRDYWTKHWNSLFNGNLKDTAETNMFFDKPWSEVSEKEIEDLGEKLSSEIGGWIFHNKVDFSKKPHWITTKEFKQKCGIEFPIDE